LVIPAPPRASLPSAEEEGSQRAASPGGATLLSTHPLWDLDYGMLSARGSAPVVPPLKGAESQNSDLGHHRCWICLEDEERAEGMIAPCECVGTSQHVHEACLETFCLQSLARHPSPTLSVSCPICLAEYQIVERPDAANLPWRDLLRVASTDQQLLLRHCHFLLLLSPLLVSCLLMWVWLLNHWWDVYNNGDGPPLLASARRSFVHQHLPALHGALAWLPAHLAEMVQTLVQSVWQVAEAAAELPGESVDVTAEAGSPHPAGISRKWSLLYVWLQCAQWYKVLSWLFIIVLGGSDGLLPTSARQLSA